MCIRDSDKHLTRKWKLTSFNLGQLSCIIVVTLWFALLLRTYFRFPRVKFYQVNSTQIKHLLLYLSEQNGQAFQEVAEEVTRELMVEDTSAVVDCSTVFRQCSPDRHRGGVLDGVLKNSSSHILSAS